MKIKHFSFRNLCSYGNKLQEFSFSDTPELILVEGKNGGGKSTISDALTFSIYGKSSIRKTKDLPNRLNKNGYTSISFTTMTGDSVDIERGLEPNFSRLIINGADYNLPDKRRLDEYIEEELARIPFNVFSNTISLSINDFKSFVKLSPSDKRQIIDKIFGLDMINDMNRLAKAESKILQSSIQRLDSSIFSNSEILKSSESQLDELKKDLSEARQVRLNELKTNIDSITAKKEEYRKAYSELETVVSTMERAVSLASQAASSARMKLADIAEKLKIYDENKCPHCLSDLTDANHSAIKQTLIADKEKLVNEIIPSLDSTYLDKTGELMKVKPNLTSSRDAFYSMEGRLLPLKQEQSTLLLEQAENSTNETSRISEIVSRVKGLLQKAETERNELVEQLQVSQELENILSDNGMKRLLMNHIIPLLNEKILRTSKLLEFKFDFEFDDEFTPIITSLGIQVSPESLSTGEQKKMNLIVLLCIIELIKMKNQSVSLLFLDEIFSSLDVDAIYMVVDLLKAFSRKYKMTIFVISHDPLPQELFDRKFSVEKLEHFSDIRFS